MHKGVENLAPGEDPYYTIRFEDGTERNTVPEKLVPTEAPAVAPIPETGHAPAPAAAAAAEPEPAEVAGPPVLQDGWMVVPTGDVLVNNEVGVQWFDAAKAGDLGTLQRLLAQEPCLLYYRGKGISYGFVGHSALHWAAAKGHVAVVKWLVEEQNVNPNVRNNGDGTPLHAAGMGGQHETGRVLCELGIDTTLRNSQGNQARDEALHYQHPDLAQTIDHFTLARKMIKEREAGESWSIKNMKGLLASAKLSYDFSEKAEFIAASTAYLDGIRPEAPEAPSGKDSSVTVKKPAADGGEAAGDESESTDEEEMGSMMAKLLIKQGKTALSLKDEGNASFKLGTPHTIGIIGGSKGPAIFSACNLRPRECFSADLTHRKDASHRCYCCMTFAWHCVALQAQKKVSIEQLVDMGRRCASTRTTSCGSYCILTTRSA